MLNERISKFQLHLCTLNRCGLRVRLVFVSIYLDTLLPRIQNTNSESLNRTVLKERILGHSTPSLSGFKTHKYTTQTYLKHNFIDCRSIRLKVERFVVMIAKICKFKYGITWKKQRKTMFITKIK